MTAFKHVLVAALVAALGGFTQISSATEAQDADDAPRPSFETVDANLDGVITPSEAEGSWLAEVFADVDANQNGLIDRNEYETAIS